MRQADNSRVIGVIKDTKQAVESLKGQPVNQHKLNTESKSGFCVVRNVSHIGNDSICGEAEFLNNGQPTGLKAWDVMCYNSNLADGAVVQYIKRTDGSIELSAGGGGGGSTTNNITQNNLNITGAVWPIGTTEP